ncbi:MAG: hypothetical protein FWD21_00575 [Peptococcaceae bacterium]|nr:hypothetical protein [Peptococcaceae bacterium]
MAVKMDYYKSVLESLQYLLVTAGVDFWANWIDIDKSLWESEKNVEHHLSAFAGMGSINDVYICAENGHNITAGQEPWVNCAFKELKGFSYAFANAYANGRVIDLADHELITPANTTIQGECCLACGYKQTTKRNVDYYIARNIVSQEIVQGLYDNRLVSSIKECLATDLPVIKTERTRTREILKQIPVNYTENNTFLRPCSNCGSEDTAVHYWEITNT